MEIDYVKMVGLESYVEVLQDNASGETDESLDYPTMELLRDIIRRDAERIGEEVTEEQLYSLDYMAGMLHAYKIIEASDNEESDD
jgi:hypothetical protein